ncbi:MAG TPA: preprotein translocase subunit SecE [Terriglobales bacterium]|nr:preprotein translocase subunit SecE [Terriglobales bacterium]
MALPDQLSNLREVGPRAVNFFNEVWLELRKVHWPTRNETYAATVVVLVVTLTVATFLGLVDFALSYLIRAVLS